MRALEQECARESESGNGLARGAFTLALQSFGMNKGKTTALARLYAAVANEENIFVADIKGAFLYAMLLPPYY